MVPINILVVDYREENILTLQELLKPGDTGVFFTKSSNEALKVAWEIPVSIALIDVQIPETDGFELAEMLRSNSRTKDILVVFLIARSERR